MSDQPELSDGEPPTKKPCIISEGNGEAEQATEPTVQVTPIKARDVSDTSQDELAGETEGNGEGSDSNKESDTAETQDEPVEKTLRVYMDPKEQAYVEGLTSRGARERYDQARAAFADRPDILMSNLFRALKQAGPPYFGLQTVQTKLDDLEESRGGWKPAEKEFKPEIGMLMREMFEGEYFEGRVIDGPEDVVNKVGQVVPMWHVEWEDGDEADYEIDELYRMWPGCSREPTPVEGRPLAALELFCGRGIVTHHFWKLGFKVQSIDNDPVSNATIKADVLSLEPKDLKVVPDFIWASPPCQTYSNMAGGKHRSQGEPEKSPEALQHNFFFTQMAKFMRYTRAHHPHAIFVIENPVGQMACMPLMKALERELGLYKATVDYCMFGRDEKKPTCLWTTDRGLHGRLSGCRCTHPPGSHEDVRSNAHYYDYSSIPESLASVVSSYVYSKLTLDGVREWPAKKPN